MQIKVFITAFVMATKLEIIWRLRKRKHYISPSTHILWIISHLWKTRESDQCSLTWKDIQNMSLNELKRKASCWLIHVIWSPHLFFFFFKVNRKQNVACTHLTYISTETGVDDTDYFLVFPKFKKKKKKNLINQFSKAPGYKICVFF